MSVFKMFHLSQSLKLPCFGVFLVTLSNIVIANNLFVTLRAGYLSYVAFQILRMAFSRDRIPSRPHSTFGEIWQTSTTFGDIWTVHTAFLAETKGFGAVDWDMLGFTGN